MEWSINVRCEPRDRRRAGRRDQRRLPRRPARPRPRPSSPGRAPGALREPGYVMRFRKERSFVYSLIADGEQHASSPLEQIARAQVAVGAPSIVRFQLTPTPSFFEALARRLYRRTSTSSRARNAGDCPTAGCSRRSTAPRCAPPSAPRTAACSGSRPSSPPTASEACKTVAAAVQSRRGENRLHRRWMIVRQRLYRRRFPRALGPLVPSTRVLVSAAEVAHLLELPSARMKGVPVRRVTLPRIPAPPERHPRAPQPTRHAPTRSATAGRLRRLPTLEEHTVTTYAAGPRGPVSDAAGRERRGPDPPLRPQVRGAAGRRPGHREDQRAARLLPQRRRGPRRGADRDRPQVRALAHLPADHPARLRQAGLVPRPRPPGVRDDPAAADRRPAAGDRGRADRRERRRRAAGHQREPDLPVLAPLPLPRRDRRDRDRRHASSAAPTARGRLHAAAPRQGRVPRHRSPRRAPTSPTSTRPPSSSAQSCPTTCGWRPAASPSGSTRRATRSPGSPASRRSDGSSTTPPTSRCGRSSRRATS